MAENFAVVCVERRHVVVKRIEIPSLKPNQVLIETEFSLMSTGTELTVISG